MVFFVKLFQRISLSLSLSRKGHFVQWITLDLGGYGVLLLLAPVPLAYCKLTFLTMFCVWQFSPACIVPLSLDFGYIFYLYVQCLPALKTTGLKPTGFVQTTYTVMKYCIISRICLLVVLMPVKTISMFDGFKSRSN